MCTVNQSPEIPVSWKISDNRLVSNGADVRQAFDLTNGSYLCLTAKQLGQARAEMDCDILERHSASVQDIYDKGIIAATCDAIRLAIEALPLPELYDKKGQEMLTAVGYFEELEKRLFDQ